MKNYYYILGLENTASENAIKQAFYYLSKKFHPDVNPDDAHAERMFKDVNEAYQVLSNKNSKAQYDFDYIQWISGNYATNSNASDTLKEIRLSRKLLFKVEKIFFFLLIIATLITAIIIITKGKDFYNVIYTPIAGLVINLFFLPTVIAFFKNHPSKNQIFALNFLAWIPILFPFGWLMLLLFSLNIFSANFLAALGLAALFFQHQDNRKNNRY